jgi:hypothetical protein
MMAAAQTSFRLDARGKVSRQKDGGQMLRLSFPFTGLF